VSTATQFGTTREISFIRAKTDKKEKTVNILRYLIIENVEIMEKSFLRLFIQNAYIFKKCNGLVYYNTFSSCNAAKFLYLYKYDLYKYDVLKENLRDTL